MCGIFGIYSLRGRTPIDDARVHKSLLLQKHRGPNAQTTNRIDDRVIFSHARLSIIDLSEASNQPFHLGERYWLVYNGELYNYRELKSELQALGDVFQTDGDTEVLLKAYVKWGNSCVNRFNGMWSFAIYDKLSKTLFCSRDRFGEKPFNYYFNEKEFIFSSEIKSILAYRPDLKKPNYEAISNFCRTSVGAQNEQTWFTGVFRLAPGCNLTVSDGGMKIERYWSYPNAQRGDISLPAARDEYKYLLNDAVRIRMRSDVPLGLSLSSGIDSTSIACLMALNSSEVHHSFTAGYRSSDQLTSSNQIYADSQSIDEVPVASKISSRLGFKHHVVTAESSSFLVDLSNIIYHLESGNSSSAVVPWMQMLAFAREHVIVLLDGQGADELLAGHVVSAIVPSVLEHLAHGRVLEAIYSIKEFSSLYRLPFAIQMALRDLSNDVNALSLAQQILTRRYFALAPELRRSSRWKDYTEIPQTRDSRYVNRLLQRQHSGTMVNLLHYGDALSMANSIENRLPFLDHRLVEFVWPLPSAYKIRHATGKYIHREALKGLVPDDILSQRYKYGFNTPLNRWLSQPERNGTRPLDVLLDASSMGRGVFDRKGMETVILDHTTGKADHGTFLFRLLSTELWFRQFID